jgi:hypothetical protein
MNPTPRRWLVLCTLLAALLTGGLALAQTTTLQQQAVSIGTSGGTSTSGSTTLHATVGQSTLPAGSSGSVSLTAGFGGQLTHLDAQPGSDAMMVYFPFLSD